MISAIDERLLESNRRVVASALSLTEVLNLRKKRLLVTDLEGHLIDTAAIKAAVTPSKAANVDQRMTWDLFWTKASIVMKIVAEEIVVIPLEVLRGIHPPEARNLYIVADPSARLRKVF